MRLPVLLFKGLVTAFCVVLPVCTVVVGIVFSCNSTLRNYALYTVTAEKAASLSALLKQEVVHSSKLCNAISSLETGKTSFSGLYTATENIGSIKYSFLNTCDNSHYYYYNNNYYYCKASDAFDLERFAKKYRRSFVFVDRYTGNVTYRSHNIPQSVLSRSDKYVQKAFGDWKAVSGRVCFWDYNTDSHRRWWEQIPWCKRTSSTPVCLEPVEVLDGVVLVHGNESPPGLGLATVAAVIAAVVVPLMFFLLFTAAVGFAIQCISKCMQDISTINSHTQSQSSGSTLWWALVPSSLAQIRTGLQGLRLCVMEMAHYTSPHFVRDIIDNVVSYTLTATKATAATELETLSSMFRDVTVMFVSLKDSGYLYSVPETRLLQVLSAFYKNFGKVIYSCNGVIDKYINGSIMAIFDVHNSGGHKDQSSRYFFFYTQ